MAIIKGRVSVVIPSRSPQYLRQTVRSLLDNADGDVEVVVVYDGRWPQFEELPEDDKRVVQMHHGELSNNKGMKASINAGVLLSTGEYLMKLDEQCSMGKGWDTILKANCEDNWVVIPRRWRLEPETWTLTTESEGDRRLPIDYMYIEYPYLKEFDKTQGLHGAEWKRPERQDLMIDDTPTSQGSCYFLKRSWWDVIGPLNDVEYGPFTMEAQEITLGTWFRGGRVIVNKNTHYAHWHKGSKGKGYGFTREQYMRHQEGMEKGRLYAIDYWLNTADFKYNWDWFVTEKFPDMPGWSTDWRQRVARDKNKDYSVLNYEEDEWLKNLRTEKL